MFQSWIEVFPEIGLIRDRELQKQVEAVCADALEIGGWTLDDLDRIPFTLLIPGTSISYRTHVRAVTRMADSVYREYEAMYEAPFRLDYDALIAGALLHDVGKIVEYTRGAQGETVKSELGKHLRHPFSGTGLAMKHGVPAHICHIIAVHAGEGDGRYRSPEAVLVNKLDMLNFTSLRAFQGLI